MNSLFSFLFISAFTALVVFLIWYYWIRKKKSGENCRPNDEAVDINAAKYEIGDDDENPVCEIFCNEGYAPSKDESDKLVCIKDGVCSEADIAENYDSESKRSNASFSYDNTGACTVKACNDGFIENASLICESIENEKK